jgi:hypothetical protein
MRIKKKYLSIHSLLIFTATFILFFSSCNGKLDYNKRLLEKSKSLYIVNDSDGRYGLMNESGEIVLELAKRSIEKLDKKGHFFAIDETILFSIKNGIIPLKMDAVQLESAVNFINANVFIGRKEKNWLLIGDKGQIINSFDQDEKLVPNLLKNFYHIKNGNQSKIFDALTHKQIISAKSVTGLREHPKNKKLLLIDSLGKLLVFNTERPDKSYSAGLVNSAFTGAAFFDSYWNAGVDSIPVIIASEKEIIAFENAVLSLDAKKLDQFKVFGFVDLNLNPLSNIRYNLNQISPYNSYVRSVYNEKSGKYSLLHKQTGLKEAQEYFIISFTSHPEWVYCAANATSFVPYFKGTALQELKSDLPLTFGPDYLISCSNFKQGRYELRDSSAQIIVPAAAQKFIPVKSFKDNKTTEAGLVGIQRNDSLFVLQLKTLKNHFIGMVSDPVDYISLLDVDLININDWAVYNLKLQKLILPFDDKDGFRNDYGKINRVGNGLISFERKVLFFNEQGALSYESLTNIIKYDGSEIISADFDAYNFYRSNSIENENDMLLALMPKVQAVNNSNKILYYFDFKGKQIWPKTPLKLLRTDFINNKADLLKRINKSNLDSVALALDKFSQNPTKELKEFIYPFVYRKSNPKGSIDLFIIKENDIRKINLRLEEIENLELGSNQRAVLKNIKSGDIILASNLDYNADKKPVQQLRVLYIKEQNNLAK